MAGTKLHRFDVSLCGHALGVIRSYMVRPDFVEYVTKQLDPRMLAYLKALDSDAPERPPTLLLNDDELVDLVLTFASGPFEFDLSWEPYEPLYRRSIECVPDIRSGLADGYVKAWAQTCTRLTEQLEGNKVAIGGGIELIHEWTSEIRRLLKAMGATNLLPCPEGTFPTPTCPKPSVNPLEDDFAGIMDELRLAIKQHPLKAKALPEELIRSVRVKNQLGRDALRALQKLGEYKGFTRARPRRYR